MHCYILSSNFRKIWITKAHCYTNKSSCTLKCFGQLDCRFSALHTGRHRWHFLVNCQVVFVPWDTMCPMKGGGEPLRRSGDWPTTGRLNHVSLSLSPPPSLSWRCRSQDQGSGSPHCSYRQGFTIKSNVEKLCDDSLFRCTFLEIENLVCELVGTWQFWFTQLLLCRWWGKDTDTLWQNSDYVHLVL